MRPRAAASLVPGHARAPAPPRVRLAWKSGKLASLGNTRDLVSMCGIVGAIAERNIVPILMEGLRRLEYRGYDSAGIAVVDGGRRLKRLRTVGKVQVLQDTLDQDPPHGLLGIAHTRWATHGVPSERNAHPHISRDGLAIVHNGIIENHEELREELKAA